MPTYAQKEEKKEKERNLQHRIQQFVENSGNNGACSIALAFPLFLS